MKIGLISDIHANIVALEAVLKDMGSVGIVLCAGDLVGYNPYPNEVLDLLKEHKVRSVLGNYDQAVITGDMQWFNPVASRTIRWTRDNLSRENLLFLKTLPVHIDYDGITVHHGSPNNLKDLVHEGDHERFCKVFDSFDVSVVVFGHTHIPRKTICGDKIILNPGSVGQPRDGDNRACYGIWDTEMKEFTIRRVEYDYKTVQSKINEVGLPRIMADRLEYGK